MLNYEFKEYLNKLVSEAKENADAGASAYETTMLLLWQDDTHLFTGRQIVDAHNRLKSLQEDEENVLPFDE